MDIRVLLCQQLGHSPLLVARGEDEDSRPLRVGNRLLNYRQEWAAAARA
jgi:hypothetical protein